MRTYYLLFAAIAFATPAWAQDMEGAAPSSETASRASDHAEAAPRSGFGQVMGVLTHLLQDAAERELGRRDQGLVLENPALEISVTPVEGATSFVRRPVRHDARDTLAAQPQSVVAAAATP